MLFFPVGILLGRERGRQEIYSNASLKIPTCESCRSHEIDVIECRAETRTFKIAVHKQFAESILRSQTNRT